MKRFLPLCLAIASCIFFVGIIIKNQWHIKHSDAVYVKLQPVDPRSIIQGDYMQLSYNLHWFEGGETVQNEEDLHQQIQNRLNVISYVLLDESRTVITASLDAQRLATQARNQAPKYKVQVLKLKNPDNMIDALYPSANSFLFSEGMAQCYAQASYAEFRVDQHGNAILYDLVNDALKSLNCTEGKSWWKGEMG